MNPDDEHYIGYSITDVGRLLRTVFERRVRAFGLTRAQWLVIARVHRRPGLSQSEAADLLEIEKAPAGRLIDRMEAKGWLERRSDPEDRRIKRLHLTARGQPHSCRHLADRRGHRRRSPGRSDPGGAAQSDCTHEADQAGAAGSGRARSRWGTGTRPRSGQA